MGLTTTQLQLQPRCVDERQAGVAGGNENPLKAFNHLADLGWNLKQPYLGLEKLGILSDW